jgi:hypothetical protein
VDVELIPEPPTPVAEAIEELVAPTPPEADPWWQAGLQEALGT